MKKRYSLRVIFLRKLYVLSIKLGLNGKMWLNSSKKLKNLGFYGCFSLKVHEKP